jgi:hypothetical protein
MLTFLGGISSRIWMYGAIALAVLVLVFGVLRGARQAGRAAERVEALDRAVRIKVAQQKAAAAAPRTVSGVVNSLRDGTF